MNHTLVTCAAIHTPPLAQGAAVSALLVLGGASFRVPSEWTPSMSLLALLNEPPFFVQLSSSIAAPTTRSLWRATIDMFSAGLVPAFHSTAISPDGRRVVAVDSAGRLVLFSIENQQRFELLREWTADALSNSAVVCGVAGIGAAPVSRAAWWDPQSLVLVRRDGSITVNSLPELANMLGDAPEKFPGTLDISSGLQDRLFVLQCQRLDLMQQIVNRRPDANALAVQTKFSRVLSLATTAALSTLRPQGSLTPPGDLVRYRVYRLLSLRSATPNDMYERYIANSNYDAALALAQRFRLATDTLYMRRWALSPRNAAAADDFLSKVHDTVWVLEQCLSCIPQTFSDTERLLKFGLRRSEDALADVRSRLQADANIILSEKEIALSFKQMALVDFLDRLFVFQFIKRSGPFNSEEFRGFRTCNIVKACSTYAENGDIAAVEALVSRYSQILHSHALSIIASLPETLDPAVYAHLFRWAATRQPSGFSGASGPSDPQIPATVRDWIHSPQLLAQVLPAYAAALSRAQETSEAAEILISGTEVYTAPAPLDESAHRSRVSEWLCLRALEIDEYSGFLKHSLALIDLALSPPVSLPPSEDVEKIRGAIAELMTVVYQSADTDVTLTHYLKLSECEQLQLLAKNAENAKLAGHLLASCKHRASTAAKIQSFRIVLKEFLLHLAHSEADRCVAFFTSLDTLPPDLASLACSILGSHAEAVDIALVCAYAVTNSKELASVCTLSALLSSPRWTNFFAQRSQQPQAIPGKVNLESIAELVRHTEAAQIFARLGHPRTAVYFRDGDGAGKTSEQQDRVRDTLRIICAQFSKKSGQKGSSLTDTDWQRLKADLLRLAALRCAWLQDDEIEKLFLESLLAAGKVNLAREMLLKTRLPKDVVESLVVRAARECFTAATSSSDPLMRQAKHTLSLLPEGSAAIVEIESLMMAAHKINSVYKLDIMPAEVALATDRTELLSRCLTTSPELYTDSAALLELSRLLGVPESSEPRVLMMAATAAFSYADYEVCEPLCRQLMHRGNTDCWALCARLGAANRFANLQARFDMTSYALAHCDPSALDGLLNQLRAIETLQCVEIDAPQALEAVIDQRIDDLQRDPSAAARSNHELEWVRRAREETAAAAQSHTSRFRALWQSDAAQYLPALSEFYEVNEKGTPNSAALSPEEARHLEQLQRLQRLEALHSSSTDKHSGSAEALLQLLFYRLLPLDTPLALAHLLSLSDPAAVIDGLCGLPGLTPADLKRLLRMASAATVIRAVAGVGQTGEAHPQLRLARTPAQLRRSLEESKIGDSTLSAAMELLAKYDAQLESVSRAHSLHAVDAGIDTVRFSTDESYRIASVHQIARQGTPEALDSSLKLARTNGLDEWAVVAAHAEALLQKIPAIDEPDHIDLSGRWRMMLLEAPQRMIEFLRSQYDLTPGTRHSRLRTIYSLLHDALTTLKTADGHEPSAEFGGTLIRAADAEGAIALLQQIVLPNAFDWKLFLSMPSQAISGVVTLENVNDLSRALDGAKLGFLSEKLDSNFVHMALVLKRLRDGEKSVEVLAPLLEAVAADLRPGFFWSLADEWTNEGACIDPHVRLQLLQRTAAPSGQHNAPANEATPTQKKTKKSKEKEKKPDDLLGLSHHLERLLRLQPLFENSLSDPRFVCFDRARNDVDAITAAIVSLVTANESFELCLAVAAALKEDPIAPMQAATLFSRVTKNHLQDLDRAVLTGVEADSPLESALAQLSSFCISVLAEKPQDDSEGWGFEGTEDAKERGEVQQAVSDSIVAFCADPHRLGSVRNAIIATIDVAGSHFSAAAEALRGRLHEIQVRFKSQLADFDLWNLEFDAKELLEPAGRQRILLMHAAASSSERQFHRLGEILLRWDNEQLNPIYTECWLALLRATAAHSPKAAVLVRRASSSAASCQIDADTDLTLFRALAPHDLLAAAEYGLVSAASVQVLDELLRTKAFGRILNAVTVVRLLSARELLLVWAESPAAVSAVAAWMREYQQARNARTPMSTPVRPPRGTPAALLSTPTAPLLSTPTAPGEPVPSFASAPPATPSAATARAGVMQACRSGAAVLAAEQKTAAAVALVAAWTSLSPVLHTPAAGAAALKAFIKTG
eukprot:TRINITY_DN5183_c0_g1_i1.p1 TRINITY_DN5183_c0_g1~~TRINITY_DN5183_c0_g1_i1.p1  ORF type:complete len:2310 (-),score=465.64 TRINITY_DN5183_c0_g1_i1:9-6341(-)